MLGRRFGKLLVLELAGVAPRRWRCVCDCGREHVALGDSLRRSLTSSCGCISRARKKGASDATAN